jgi:hypothetical protein
MQKEATFLIQQEKYLDFVVGVSACSQTIKIKVNDAIKETNSINTVMWFMAGIRNRQQNIANYGITFAARIK